MLRVMLLDMVLSCLGALVAGTFLWLALPFDVAWWRLALGAQGLAVLITASVKAAGVLDGAIANEWRRLIREEVKEATSEAMDEAADYPRRRLG